MTILPILHGRSELEIIHGSVSKKSHICYFQFDKRLLAFPDRPPLKFPCFLMHFFEQKHLFDMGPFSLRSGRNFVKFELARHKSFCTICRSPLAWHEPQGRSIVVELRTQAPLFTLLFDPPSQFGGVLLSFDWISVVLCCLDCTWPQILGSVPSNVTKLNNVFQPSNLHSCLHDTFCLLLYRLSCLH